MTYMIEFTVCALCGWLYEVGLELIVNHAYHDRGVLHLPLIPIYGFGGLLLLLVYRKKEYSSVFIFISSMIMTTLLELIASYPIEKVLGYLPWSYRTWFLNFDGRISLPSSIIFGLLSLLLMKVIHPLCRKLENAQTAAVIIAGIMCMALFVTDGVILLINIMGRI